MCSFENGNNHFSYFGTMMFEEFYSLDFLYFDITEEKSSQLKINFPIIFQNVFFIMYSSATKLKTV